METTPGMVGEDPIVDRFVNIIIRSPTDTNNITTNISVFLGHRLQNPAFKKVYDLSSIEIARILKIHVGKELECVICLEHFKLRQKVYKLKCNHMFHLQCGKVWLKENGTCPTCRRTIEVTK